MRTFYDSITHKAIGVSLKGMWSYFRHDHRFQKEPCPRVDFFVVRNPYARAVSCFHDKFRRIFPDRPTGDVQKMFMRHFNVTLEGLKTVTFEDFVFELDLLALEDEHCWPQTRDVVPWKVMIQMETDLPILTSVFGLDFTVKHGASEHEPYRTYYTRREITSMVRSVYLQDFLTLRYPLEL